VWQSADPAFSRGEYLATYPTDEQELRELGKDPLGYWKGKLPGRGGVYNSPNGAVFSYAHLNPVKLTDPDGNWVGWDDLVFAVGGGVIGAATQGFGDLINGKVSGWSNYTGAIVGGAASGETLLYTANPVAAGAVGGGVSNLVTQGIDIKTGKKDGFDFGDFTFDTVLGGVLGKIPTVKVPGITQGRGSAAQVFKQMRTKLQKGLVESIKPGTAEKMFQGALYEYALKEGAAVFGLIKSAQNALFGDD